VKFESYILDTAGFWERPSFKAPDHVSEEAITCVLLREYGGFLVAGLTEDPDAPDDIRDLCAEFEQPPAGEVVHTERVSTHKPNLQNWGPEDPKFKEHDIVFFWLEGVPQVLHGTIVNVCPRNSAGLYGYDIETDSEMLVDKNSSGRVNTVSEAQVFGLAYR
jgi:hypothetical protein